MPPKGRRGKNVGDQSPKRPKKDKIPKSIVDTLVMIREGLDDFQSQEKFVDSLRKIGRRFEGGVDGTKTLSNIETKSISLKYEHLENYRDYTHLPVGVLLLFSRMSANRRNFLLNPKAEKNSDLVDKIKKIIESIDDDTEFDVNELRRWTEIMGRGKLF